MISLAGWDLVGVDRKASVDCEYWVEHVREYDVHAGACYAWTSTLSTSHCSFRASDGFHRYVSLAFF